MASPQKENGFTQLSNEIMEIMCKTKLNGTQFSIVMVVWRYTYGFQRKDHELSETFISKAVIINKRQVQRELKKLIEEKILKVTKEETKCSPRRLMFNKNHDEWGLKRQVVTKKTPGDELDTSPGDELDTSTGDELDTSSGDELDTQERKKESIKENIKERDSSSKINSNCFSFYNKNFGPITQFITNDISSFLDDGIEDELVIKSLELSLEKNINNWSYAKAILNDCIKKNITTLEQFMSKKKNDKIDTSKKEPDYSDRTQYTETGLYIGWKTML